MVVVLGTVGAIALGATLVGGGATIGALAASKSGNESRTIQRAINDISTKIKKEIETIQENHVSTQNVTIQKTSVTITGGVDIDLGCCQNINCNVIKIKQTAESQTTANILATQDSLNDIATNVANKLDAEQKATTDQTTSALGSLLAAGNKADTDSEVRNISKTEIEDTIKTSLKNTIDNLQSTDQSAPVVIEGGVHIGCSLGSRIGNKIFGTGDSTGKDVSGGLSLVDIEQGSISAIAASIAAKQVVKNIVKDTVATDASSKQTAITTQKAGDMMGIAIICAICVMGVLGYKYLKSSGSGSDPCSKLRGVQRSKCIAQNSTKFMNDYKKDHGVYAFDIARYNAKKSMGEGGSGEGGIGEGGGKSMIGEGYRSLTRRFKKNKDLLVSIFILLIVLMYQPKNVKAHKD